MVNRFIHIGDVHLLHGHPRNPDRLRALDQIVHEQARRAGLAAWLIPGDLFHQRSTADDRNALAARLQAMADAAPVVLVRGNHDAPGDLDIFARLKATWPVYVQTLPGIVSGDAFPLPTGDLAAIAALPYPTKAGLAGAGVAPGDVVKTAAELLDVTFMQLAYDLSLASNRGGIPLFLGHVNIKGAIASTGQPQIGAEIEIDQAMLARLPAIYCGVSHIHRPQEVGRGVFAGSIAAMDYGEIEPKSYVIVEAFRNAASAWQCTWSRAPIGTPPMFHVTGELTRDGFVLTTRDPEIERRYQTGEWAGCDVRARYSYRTSERAVLNEAVVRERFAGALRLKVEAMANPDRELRAPAVAAARTLAEKLQAWCEIAGTTATTSVLEKLARLEHTDPQQLLTDLERELARLEAGDEPASEAA